MLVIDEALDGSRDLLRCKFQAHLVDGIVKGLAGHHALLYLIVVGVVEGLLDAFLDLTLLLLSLLLNGLVASSSTLG